MASKGIPEGASFAYGVGLGAIDSQLRRIDSLDTKAAVILAVDGVLAGLLFDKYTELQGLPRVLRIVIVCLLLGSFLTALRAFATRKYATAPQISAVVRWMVRDEDWLKWRFLGNLQEAEWENDKKLDRKVRWLSVSIGALFVDIVISGGYLLWVLWRY